MDKFQIKIADFKRIFIGNAPVEFMLEVLVRTIIIYFFLLIIMRLLGKRMSGQLTIADFAITIMLGAIVAPPMETPDRGVLQGIFILFLVLLYHRCLTWWGVKKSKVEAVMYGTLSILVKDGILQMEELKKTRISRAQLFSMLRQKKIYNMGEVQRVYLEACGIFTVIRAQQPKAGLSVLPRIDERILDDQHKVEEGIYACENCGATQKITDKDDKCNHCGSSKWNKAVL
jgi:uncharacterized membrane protein YcaP (DUF421 family)